MKYSIYLGGPISGLSYNGCTNWRDSFTAQLKPYHITTLNPLRYMDHLKEETQIKYTYDHCLTGTSKAIFTQDLFDVRRCDLMVANFLGAIKVSVGTIAEIAVAHENKKPIVSILDPGNVNEHPFVTEMSSVIVINENDALFVIKSILLPEI